MDTLIEAPKAEHRTAQVPAAKLHVLHLAPIKAKLGPKWDRLSGLVHSVFEKSLRRAQGPADHFVQLDEMSYVVAFHHLSLEEASVACAAVAKEVCDLLFGADVDDIAIRGLVGLVPSALLKNGVSSARIAELLEQGAGEILVTHGENPDLHKHEAKKNPPAKMADTWLEQAQDLAEQAKLTLALFPVWELAARRSSSLYLSLISGSRDHRPAGVRRLLGSRDGQRIVQFEATLLQAAAEYALRVHSAGKTCALGVGVSYETLSGFHSRIPYIGALKSVRALNDCPLLLRIEQVPDGTPIARLAEIVAMLRLPNIRISVQFEAPQHLDVLGVRLGAMGLGGVLPPHCDTATASAIAHRLARRAEEQKAFAFLHGLDDPALVEIARQNHIRFGSGEEIGGGRRFTVQEAIPDFPLTI